MKRIILHRDGVDPATELFAKRQHVHDEGLEGRSSVRRVILFGALVLLICSAHSVCAQSIFIVDRLTDTAQEGYIQYD